MNIREMARSVIYSGMKERSFKKKLVLREYLMGGGRFSWSLNFEDVIIERILEESGMGNNGIYVDVGCHHPIHVNNTYRLYLKGWRGVNIDPNPECIKLFNRFRPKDMNINYAVADTSDKYTYYMYDIAGENTINDARADFIKENQLAKLIGTKEIKTIKLCDVLGRIHGQVDVLNIDVETMEMAVLRSNEWGKYRPKYIIMESLGHGSDDVAVKDEAMKYLEQNSYIEIAKVLSAVFYKDVRK